MTHSIDKSEGFKLVKRARELISGVNKHISEATQRQYEAAFARMAAQELAPEKIANTSRGYYYYRAAWVHHYSTLTRQKLNAADEASRQGDNGSWHEIISELPILIKELERYRPDPESKHLEKQLIGKWAIEAERRTNAGEKILKHSKRFRLRGLSQDWRTKMFEGLRQSSKYRDIVATLSATGARPSEFATGIYATLEPDGIRFKIHGTKTHGGKYGQEERSFCVRIDRPELAYLRDRLKLNEGQLLINGNPGAISDKVRQLSNKVFPKLKNTVSAYVFRHQMAADLKASGLSDEDVSAALGHSVDETKGMYGAAQSAKNPGSTTGIQASNPVRLKTREKIKRLERSNERSHDR